jgi:surface antigen
VKNLLRFLWLALSIASLGAAAPTLALGSGANLFLRANVTEADSVGITVAMGGFPYEDCQATISTHGRSQSPRKLNTGKLGGARWSWLVPANVGPGRWKFSVTCTGGRALHHASKTFMADGGIGRSARGLWIPRSMKERAIRIKTSTTEIGNGGGEGSLYPEGQCTWWVARRRPDLPLFPGKSGNALNWAKSAERAGFPVGVVPAVHAVAVFQPGQYGAGHYGHVAYVTAVRGSKITISEDNFQGGRRPDTRTISASGLEFIYEKGEMGPPPDVELLSPDANAIAQGSLNLIAKSNASAVRFLASYYANPADPHSFKTVAVGEDKSPSDGFVVNWDTTPIPNQGGPGGTSVVVTATALDGNGNPTGSPSSARVNVANSRNAGGQTYYPYYVVGTCEDGECGLHERSGPGYTSYALVGRREDGEEIDVVCQAYGEEFTSTKTGDSSRVWDKLTNGNWVIDYYVDTPNRGKPSLPLPPCP